MNVNPCVQLGKAIKKRRAVMRYSLKELAKRASMSEKRLLNIELGKTNLLLGTIVKIAEALNLEAYELVKIAEEL